MSSTGSDLSDDEVNCNLKLEDNLGLLLEIKVDGDMASPSWVSCGQIFQMTT